MMVSRVGVTGQQIWSDEAVAFCAPTVVDHHCLGCARLGTVHDQIVRRLIHLPMCRKATWLHVTGPRHRCTGCGRVWRHCSKTPARARSKLTEMRVG